MHDDTANFINFVIIAIQLDYFSLFIDLSSYCSAVYKDLIIQ